MQPTLLPNHTTDNNVDLFDTHRLDTTGTSAMHEGREEAHPLIAILQHRSLEQRPVPKPDITGGLRGTPSSSTHISLRTSLLQSISPRLSLCIKLCPSAEKLQTNLSRSTSTSHSVLQPQSPAPSRSRMPALATHISAPNLRYTPTTSISTSCASRGKLRGGIQVFNHQRDPLRCLRGRLSHQMRPVHQAADHAMLT
jgi:hypothetical protein